MSHLRQFTAILTFIVSCSPVFAQTWNTTTGTWNTPANWTPTGVPTSGNTTALTFNNTGTGYTSTNDFVTAPFSLNSLTVNNTGTGTVTIAGSTGSLLNFAGITPSINTSAGITAISANFGGSGPLVKNGTGTLLVNGTANFTGSGLMTVANGTIGGTGTISSPAQGLLGSSFTLSIGTAGNTSAISAGNGSGGTLNISGGVLLNNNPSNGGGVVRTVYRITDGSTPSTTNGGSTIGGTTNPTSNNLINVTSGGLNVTGTDAASVANLQFVIDGTGANFTPGASYSYTVAHILLLPGVPEPLASNGLALSGAEYQPLFSTVGFTASNFALNSDDNGFMYIAFTVTPVPEPGSMLLVGVGVVQLIRRRRVAKLV